MGLLEEKVVIVTGAGRGIGRGIALCAAQEGAKVVVCDLGGSSTGEGADQGPAQEVVNEIRAAGGEAIASTESVAEWKSAHRIIETAVDTFGRLDGLVNNAGILRDRIFHKMEESDFEAVLNVHLKGSFYTSRAAADHFRKQSSGAYVHMTSTSGLIGNFGQANYMAAKLGVVGLSRAIALDMSRYQVRSNCISPFAWSRLVGTIPTNSPEEERRVERMKQMTPEKIAPLAVYLMSDDAKDVSGQIFCVRNNEIFLFNQPRPIRSVHTAEGWTPQGILETAMPAMRGSLTPLERSPDVFCWDPI
ncbi:MAG: SDR family NAD(P)-dependent oxidoreductase [Alphaproteobacteria bacterium]